MPQKYLTESDKMFKRVNPEYAKNEHRKQVEASWLNNHKKNVISTLPKRLASNFSSYNFNKVDDVQRQSVFIYGEAGTGKSVLSAYIYQKFVQELYVLRGYFSGLTYNYIIFPDFISEMQNDFNDSNGLLKKCCECDVLVLDDFGIKKMTEYTYSIIYRVINHRYLTFKLTIINSNHTLRELKEQIDDRIIRRIEEDYLIINKKPFNKI